VQLVDEALPAPAHDERVHRRLGREAGRDRAPLTAVLIDVADRIDQLRSAVLLRTPRPRIHAGIGTSGNAASHSASACPGDPRHYLAPQLGKTPEDMTSGQISCDLRRLRAHQIIERIPRSRSYQVTADGLTIALSSPAWPSGSSSPASPQLTGIGPPADTRLRQADRAYKTAITDLAQQASLAA
jgi:hypothetical protein